MNAEDRKAISASSVLCKAQPLQAGLHCCLGTAVLSPAKNTLLQPGEPHTKESSGNHYVWQGVMPQQLTAELSF